MSLFAACLLAVPAAAADPVTGRWATSSRQAEVSTRIPASTVITAE
jgi:hypothetical protein